MDMNRVNRVESSVLVSFALDKSVVIQYNWTKDHSLSHSSKVIFLLYFSLSFNPAVPVGGMNVNEKSE
jgi:hypothetical protein